MLAWLQDEKPASDKVRSFLDVAESGEMKLMMNLINLGEVYYRLIRSKGEEVAKAFWRDFRGMPIQLLSVTRSLTLIAAGFKGRYPIAYADAFAAATAKVERCPLVTGDPELKALEGAIEIEWLRKM
jgi:predicted nucleic acid-binding protein